MKKHFVRLELLDLFEKVWSIGEVSGITMI